MSNVDNNLFSALSQPDQKTLKPYLKKMQAGRGDILQEQGADVNYTHFPCGGSLVAFEVIVAEGNAIQTILIGREGAVGGIVSNGHLPAYARARVIFPGLFLKIAISELDRAKNRSPSIASLFTRYSDCLVAQFLQSAACNAAHPIEQRMAKWLRFALDRTGGKEVPLTQEQLAHMLGVSRTYVTRVIQRLKNIGILDTKRGALSIRDLGAIQRLCCGCHDTVCHHFETVLRGVYPGNRAGRTEGENPGIRLSTQSSAPVSENLRRACILRSD
jgi:Crp-like helix-turn-helix protein